MALDEAHSALADESTEVTIDDIKCSKRIANPTWKLSKASCRLGRGTRDFNEVERG